MESIKTPSPTALAMGTLVVIWTEAARRRVSVWVALKDTMDVMERRRTLVAAQKAHAGIKARKPEPEPDPEPDYSEAQNVYERMRSQSRRPTFR